MFLLRKKHTIGNRNIKVHVCTKCDKSWCYMYPRCQNNSIIDCCEVCQKKNDLSTPSLSPITTQCDPVIASKLIESLPHLRSLDFEKQLLPEIWKELLIYQFTHLHETDHNIFSPNKVNSQPVDGMFL